MRIEDLVRLGWNTLRTVTVADASAGSSEARILKGDCFVKLGKRSVIEPEALVYQRLRAHLNSVADVLLPLTSLQMLDQDQWALFVEPIEGEMLQSIILRSDLGSQMRVTSAVTQAMEHLERLRAIEAPDPQAALQEFVIELVAALRENLKRAEIADVLPELDSQSRFSQYGKATLAHRDLSVVNVIVGAAGVKFIDPRAAVPNAGSWTGSYFASPAMDLIAFAVSLQRKELELQAKQPTFQLSARQLVAQALTEQVRLRLVPPALVDLMWAVSWSVYAACKCQYCLAPERVGLYQQMVANTLTSLETLREE